MKNISEHISYKEATYSNTATRKGIDNIPNDEQLSNMELILTPLGFIVHFGDPTIT